MSSVTIMFYRSCSSKGLWWWEGVSYSNGRNPGMLQVGTFFRAYRYAYIKVKVTLIETLRLCTGRTAHTGSRGIALPFHDHGIWTGWGVSVTPRPLFTPGKDPVLIVQEAGWAPGPVWTGGISRPRPGFDPRSVQPVASRYTDWAVPAHVVPIYIYITYGKKFFIRRIS